jgi:hypothetical protein
LDDERALHCDVIATEIRELALLLGGDFLRLTGLEATGIEASVVRGGGVIDEVRVLPLPWFEQAKTTK